jgi:hypothetical protein
MMRPDCRFNAVVRNVLWHRGRESERQDVDRHYWGGNDELNLFPGSTLTPGQPRRQRTTKTSTAPRTTALSVKLSAIRSIFPNYIRGFVLVLRNPAVEWFGVQLRWIVMNVATASGNY